MKFKWADAVQAQERLTHTYLMYGKDVVFIEEVRSSGVVIRFVETNIVLTVKFDDPNWNDYRRIPPGGWVNIYGGPSPRCILLGRVPARVRRHGLYPDVATLREIADNSVVKNRDMNLNGLLSNTGYRDLLAESYPSIDETLDRLPRRSSSAISRKFAIYRDAGGVAWVFRRNEQVGFLSKGSLHVFPDTSFYKDEVLEVSPNIAIKDLV